MKLTQLEPNTGQIEGLPLNPRQWTKTDIDKLAVSLTETPELFEARPIICVPHGGKYVILGGNLRYEASKANKAKEVPCVVLPADMPIAKMKEIVIKDNGSFGAWDYDELANEWDDLPLTDWGVPAWEVTSREDIEREINDMLIEPGAKAGESETGAQSFTFVFRVGEAEIVQQYISQEGKEKLQAEILELCRNAVVK